MVCLPRIQQHFPQPKRRRTLPPPQSGERNEADKEGEVEEVVEEVVEEEAVVETADDELPEEFPQLGHKEGHCQEEEEV